MCLPYFSKQPWLVIHPNESNIGMHEKKENALLRRNRVNNNPDFACIVENKQVEENLDNA